MGTLRSSDQLPQLEAEVVRTLSHFPAAPARPPMDFGPVYRETVTGHYVFADVSFPEPVQQWRKEVQKAVGAFFVEPARTTDVPHLTLGHVSEDLERIDTYINGNDLSVPQCDIQTVDISMSGSKGIKQAVLKTLPLAF